MRLLNNLFLDLLLFENYLILRLKYQKSAEDDDDNNESNIISTATGKFFLYFLNYFMC